MTQTCANVLMGGATLWYSSATGTAFPNESTVAFGGDWSGTWTEVGLTNAPLSFGVTTNLAAAMVEQRVRPVRRRVTSMEEVLEFQLAEITANNFALLVNGTTTGATSTTVQKPYEQFDASANDFSLDQRSWGWEGENIASVDGSSQPVRFKVNAGEAIMNGNLELSREGEGWGLPGQVLVDDDCSGTAPWSLQKVTGPVAS